jgi:hypothetical protein
VGFVLKEGEVGMPMITTAVSHAKGLAEWALKFRSSTKREHILFTRARRTAPKRCGRKKWKSHDVWCYTYAQAWAGNGRMFCSRDQST